jgi:hypothetical protein
LFPIIVVRQLRDILLIRQKTAFHQDGGVSHIGDDEELLRPRAAIHRLGVGDQGLLNESSQALAFDVRRFRRCALQKRQP